MYFACLGRANKFNIYEIISFEEIESLPKKVSWYRDTMLKIAPQHFTFNQDGMIIKHIPIIFKSFYITENKSFVDLLSDSSQISSIWFITPDKFIIEFPYYRDFIGAKLYVC